ncbi:MAG: response regulator transcription factor [Chloroflexi bacterium]|nr:response regulator transcription factor [Chloroflexota bacterium]
MPVYDPTSFDPNGRLIALVHILRNVDRTKRLERTVREFVTSAEDTLSPRVTNSKIVEPETVHLTERELEVLRLVAHGSATDAIAEKLGISRHTSRNHIASLLAKLGLHSRVEAAAYAFEHDLA